MHNHDGKGKCKAIWDAPILCCSHYCAQLADKVEVNAGNPGGGPFCGKAPERNEKAETCESAYWTGGNLNAYACRYEADRILEGKKPCRLALGEACVC